MDEAPLILEGIANVILLLSFGIVTVIVSRKVRLSPIVGYLLLGLILNLLGRHLMSNGSTVQTLAELGVVFLLFDIGVHFSFGRIRAQASNIFGFGALQVVLGTIGLGIIAMLFGLSASVAFLTGATLALSSTAVVAQLIAEKHQATCPVGTTATSILIFQDIASIAILIVATTMGSTASALPQIGAALGKAVIAFVVAAALARLVARPALALIARTENDEVFTATALLIALAAAWATASAGLSMSLGAFLGGTILADSPYRAVIQSEIKPFRGLLLGFFFMSVGLSLDGGAIGRHWPLIIGLTALIFAAKILLNGLASLAFRWSTPGSTQLGFLLAQGSEFAFVILSLPSVVALLGKEADAVLVAAVALTLAFTPSVAAAGRRLAGRMRARKKQAADAELVRTETTAAVLLFCMNVRGRATADALSSFGITYLAVESEERRLSEAIADGYDVIFGSMGDPRLWRPIAMNGRKLNLVTEPQFDMVTNVMPAIRAHFPNLPMLAASRHEADVEAFRSLGLRSVVDKSPDGVDFAVQVLLELGVDRQAAQGWADRQRHESTVDHDGMIMV